jgi:hypothetical protein
MNVSACANDLIAKMQKVTIAELDGKVIACDTMDEVLTRLGSKLLKRPAIGIMYEGARSVGDNQMGGSAEIVFSALLLYEVGSLVPKSDASTAAMLILDAMRDQVQGTTSPTKHKWKWVLEAQAAEKGSHMVWLQRWSTPTAVIPRR